MKIIFWVFFSLIILIYFGYPLILIVITYFRRRPHQKEGIEPSVTLLIPAYNEEKVIREKIENSLSLDYPKDKLEVILVLDGCTDKSKDIAQEYINQGLVIIEQRPRKGKIAALNMAVSQAKGEILIFTDANSMYEKDAIRKLVRNFADKRVGCVCGELRYTLKENMSIESGENLYWKYEKFLKIKESQLDSLLVTNGSIYAIRKKLYEPIDEDLADDFVNPMRIAKKGFGIIYEPEAIALERVSSLVKDQFSQKVRIISQGWKATFRLWNVVFSSGLLRSFEFLFHKFLRWLVPLFLLIIFISNLFLLEYQFYAIIFVAQIVFYSLALIGYNLQEKGSRLKVFYIPFYFCIVNLASLMGLLKFLKGKETRIWEKAQTTRE